MESLDVDSLFTNILLEETIDDFANTFFEKMEKVGLSKIELKELLFLATKESYLSYFILSYFNGKLYKEVDGATISTPLGPTVSNAFNVQFKRNWLQNCPSDFKPY